MFAARYEPPKQVTKTIKIPENTVVVGELWPIIMASGSFFANQAKPEPVVQVGNPGDKGTVEISSMLFSTKAGSAGAILLEWNLHDRDGSQGQVGLWDSHIRLGGATGTNLGVAECLAQTHHSGTSCQAAYLSLHITASASGYFEVCFVVVSLQFR
jgi:glucan 1,3-beta-glucosidase